MSKCDDCRVNRLGLDEGRVDVAVQGDPSA